MIVEDNPVFLRMLTLFFRSRGFAVVEATTVAGAIQAQRAGSMDAAILDHELPDGNALELLELLREEDGGLPILILTAHASIDLAVRAIKAGADQFLTKPAELPALLVMVQRLIENQRNRQMKMARIFHEKRELIDPFAGTSTLVRRLADQAARVAHSASPILIQGETGTGKGLLAAWLHRNGPRRAEAFVDLNCAGLSRELLESELFGYKKGAFTGAFSNKPGLLETAHRGTLFLDEIGDSDIQVQPKMLKFLEEQRFRKLGDVKDRQVDIRLIAASHIDLRQLVAEGRFREDLFYRVSTIPLFVPPLRERKEDIRILSESTLDRIAKDLGRPHLHLSEGAAAELQAYTWPGNIRELRNVLERAALLTEEPAIKATDIAAMLSPAQGALFGAGNPLSLDEAEKLHIERVLHAEGGNVPSAAKTLGLSRSALYQKLKKHGITPSKAS